MFLPACVDAECEEQNKLILIFIKLSDAMGLADFG